MSSRPRSSRTGAGALVAGLALTIGLSGCGAGQQASTAEAVTASGGAAGQVGSIEVRNAQFAWTGSVTGGAVYQPGQDVTLQVSIVNDRTVTLPDAMAPDTLLSVSSPIARSGRIVGDARIGDGQVLTSGYDRPVASIPTSDTREVTIMLLGLTEPLRAGMNYPVVFTFARAGELRLEVPVENPAAPRTGTPPEPEPIDTLETGPDPLRVPR